MNQLPLTPADLEAETRATEAMNEGFRLRTAGDGPHAIECFDQARRLREAIAARVDHPLIQFNLAGTWLNLADVQAEQGPALFPSAVAAYDRALEVLERARVDPRLPVRHRRAVGVLNRACALLQGGPEEVHRATTGLEELRAELAAGPKEPWTGALEAAACANLSRAQFQAGRWQDAIETAEAGLTAATNPAGGPEQPGLIRTLFHFAADGYAAHQPRFLAEFSRELCGRVADARTASAIRQDAIQAMRLAIGRLTSGAFARVDAPEFQQTLEILRELRETVRAMEREASVRAGPGPA